VYFCVYLPVFEGPGSLQLQELVISHEEERSMKRVKAREVEPREVRDGEVA
jgi:hypothetical protein